MIGRESSSAPATPMKSSKKLNSESSSGNSSDNSTLQIMLNIILLTLVRENVFKRRVFYVITLGEENRLSSTVSVPRPDDETFTNFFSSLSLDKCKDETLNLSENDFDSVTSVSKL